METHYALLHLKGRLTVSEIMEIFMKKCEIFKPKYIASGLIKFSADFQPPTSLQTLDSTASFKFLHLYISICIQSL